MNLVKRHSLNRCLTKISKAKTALKKKKAWNGTAFSQGGAEWVLGFEYEF